MTEFGDALDTDCGWKQIAEQREAELDELRRSSPFDRAMERIMELEAEVADLRASSVVVVRRKCETCGGSGSLSTGHLSRFPHQSEQPCPDCDNGWRLAEGVIPVVRSGMPDRWYHSFTDHADGYVVPARMIEGDT